MAFEVRRVDYYYTVIPDVAEHAGRLLAELAGQGVNLLAFSAVPMGPARTELTLFPEDGAALEAAARHAGFALDGPHGAFLVQGDDELGALSRVHGLLSQAGVDRSVRLRCRCHRAVSCRGNAMLAGAWWCPLGGGWSV